MRFFAWYWGGAIVALPLFFRIDTLGDLRFTKDTFFIALTFMSLIVFGFKRELTYQHKIIASLFAVVSALLFFNQHNLYSSAVVMQWLCLNVGMILVLQMLTHFSTWDISLILNSMAITCLIQSAWFICNYFSIDPYLWIFSAQGMDVKKVVMVDGVQTIINPSEVVHIIGSLGQQTLSGALIAITMPALFRNKWMWALPVAIVAICLTESAMTWLAAVFAILSYVCFKCFSKRGSIRELAIYSIPILGFVIYENIHQPFFDDQLRFGVWASTLSWVEGSAIFFGNGPGYFYDMFNRYYPMDPKWVHPHSEYINLYVLIGAFGVSVAVALIWYALQRAKAQPILGASLVALLVNSFGNFPMHMSATALVGISVFSLLAISKPKGGTESWL